MAKIPGESLIGQQLASLQGQPGALTQAAPVQPASAKRKVPKNGKKRKKGKRPPPAESLYG